MNITHVLLSAVLIGVGIGDTTAEAQVPAIQRRLEAEHLAGKFSGTAVVTLDDRQIYAGGIGIVNANTGLLANSETPWRLASITKQLTAVLVMQEVERGHLSLDQSLGDLLPQFKDNASSGVRIRQLLQHTSGLPDPSETPVTKEGVPAFYTADKADHDFCAGTPRAAAGGFHYNNCDYYLLADILRVTTGRSFAALISERISGPLKLKSLHVYAPGETEAFVAIDGADGKEPPYKMSSFEAAAGLSGSAADLEAFDRALMSGRLLRPESLKVLWQGDPNLGYVALGAWGYTVKLAGCKTPLTLVERRGGVGDVNVLNLIWPERKGALIVFSNNGATDWGQLWQDSGLMRDLVVAAWCN